MSINNQSKSTTPNPPAPATNWFALALVPLAFFAGIVTSQWWPSLTSQLVYDTRTSDSIMHSTADASSVLDEFIALYRYGDMRYIPRRDDLDVAQLLQIARDQYVDDALTVYDYSV